MSETKERVQQDILFADIKKLMMIKQDPKDKYGGWVFSVTVAGPSKTRVAIYDKTNKTMTGFSFYIIDLIPWLQKTANFLRKAVREGNKVKPFTYEMSTTIPEYARRPGKPSKADLVIGMDDNNKTFIALRIPNMKLPRFIIQPVPGTTFVDNGKLREGHDSIAGLLSYLNTFISSVDNVSDLVSGLTANRWKPPQDNEEIKSAAKSVTHNNQGSKKSDTDDFTDDIPF